MMVFKNKINSYPSKQVNDKEGIIFQENILFLNIYFEIYHFKLYYKIIAIWLVQDHNVGSP